MTMTEAPALLHKNLPVSGVKILDDEKGIVEAFVAGIGNKDSVGDIIQPGAFVDSLQTRMPKGVWSHNWDIPVSKTLEIFEVSIGDPRLPAKMAARGAGGLYVKTQFNLETQRGREAYSDVKFFGEESEWSIGYMEKEAVFDKELGANLLHKIDLYEYSPVLFGANPLTSTVAVKVQIGGADGATIQVTGLDNSDLEAKVAEAVKGVLAGKAAAEDETDEKVKTHPFMKGGEGGTCKICGKAKDDAVHDTEKADDAEGDEKAVDADAALEVKSPDDVETEAKEEAAPAVDRKSVPGSFEARQQAICDAVEDAFPGYNAWPVATFDNSVVVRVYESYMMEVAEAIAGTEGSDEDEVEDEDREGYWLFPYTLQADASITLGDPQKVDVVEVVVAKAAFDALEAKGEGVAEFKAYIGEKAMPGEVESKAGRVLSSKNLDRLTAAKTAIEEVLTSADAREPEGEEKSLEEVTDPAAPAEEAAPEEKTDEATDEKADVEEPEEKVDEVDVPVVVPENVKALYDSLIEDDAEKAAQVLDLFAKAGEVRVAVGEDADEAITEKATDLDSAIAAVEKANEAGDFAEVDALLADVAHATDELMKALGIEEEPVEEAGKTAELIELDSATLLELEMLLSDV